MNFFNKDSQAVKSALLLFSVGIYTSIEEVPNLFNLRAVVQEELNKLDEDVFGNLYDYNT